ncbi:GP1_9 [Sanghuangporus sanghuang]
MVFGVAVFIVTLAALAGAANFKRVACPDGNFASHEAVSFPFCTRLFDSQCGEDVHEVVRLTFHDAIGFSKSESGQLKGRGADGLIIHFGDIETNFTANAGIDEAVDALAPFLTRHEVSAGDLIQFAGAVGISNCPGAPRLQFLAGRPNATFPADDGTVPLPESNATTILERMDDGGFTPAETIHLLASHSIARSDTLVTNHSAVPFDSTPFVLDMQIFLEVLLKGVGVPFGMNNTDGAEWTACEWQSMVDNQQLMMVNFRRALAKLAVVGQDVKKLVDCSDIIPQPTVLLNKRATLPAGKTIADIEQVCPGPFPAIAADPGKTTQIPECPDGDLNIDHFPS